MSPTSLLIVWTICAVVAYIGMRRDYIAIVGKWKRSDRMIHVGLAILSGPFMVIGLVLQYLFQAISNTQWGKQEVKW